MHHQRMIQNVWERVLYLKLTKLRNVCLLCNSNIRIFPLHIWKRQLWIVETIFWSSLSFSRVDDSFSTASHMWYFKLSLTFLQSFSLCESLARKLLKDQNVEETITKASYVLVGYIKIHDPWPKVAANMKF